MCVSGVCTIGDLSITSLITYIVRNETVQHKKIKDSF